jgi:hypothetical protein
LKAAPPHEEAEEEDPKLYTSDYSSGILNDSHTSDGDKMSYLKATASSSSIPESNQTGSPLKTEVS